MKTYKVGYAGGTFDLLHPGHLGFLKKCKQQCDQLMVSVNTDEFAERYKRRPIMTLSERVEMLRAVKGVDEVISNFGDEDSKLPVLAMGADAVFYGSDWLPHRIMVQMGFTPEWLTENEVVMVCVPYTDGISSSDIILRCQQSPL